MALVEDLGPHRVHLRDFYTGVRNGSITGVGTGPGQIPQAQLLHVIADFMLAVVLALPWTYDDPPEPSPDADDADE